MQINVSNANSKEAENSRPEQVIALLTSTAENIHQLKRMIPDLPIDEGDLSDNLKKCTTKKEIKQIISTVQKAITEWENSIGQEPLNLDDETDLIKQFGYKHARQLEMANFFEDLHLPGIKMPSIEGISVQLMRQFLDQEAPLINEEWIELDRLFLACADKSSFLEQKEVKNQIHHIQSAISQAFENADRFFFSAKLLDWLQRIKDSGNYLMVRSSGAEDSSTIANAGGNESIAYVKPEKEELCHALGKVVKSFYGLNSLKNRINGSENPFSIPNQVSVSLSQLIGEKIGVEKSSDEIPVSLVLFTNEPTFVRKEPFRVMRISATYGHGEGVVGSVGIKSDSILILRSVKYPDRLYILEDNAVKQKRLAPIFDPLTEKIKLEKVDNPSDLADKPALDHVMLTRLFYLGVAIEKNYGGKPMDMELVVKQGEIYPLQSRPINRPEALPTYLDWKKIAPNTENKRILTEMFLPGNANALTDLKPDQIVIAETLEIAEKKFKQGVHRLVIVSTPEESTNSHPIVNFSGMGIPCFYKEDTTELEELLKNEGNFLACVQTGTIIAFDQNGDSSLCISSGYAVHPAKASVSVVPYPIPKVSLMRDELPQEIKGLLVKIRSEESSEVALEAIGTLKKLAQPLGSRFLTRPVSIAEQMSDSSDRLIAAYMRSLAEYKAVVKQFPDQRLHKLLHTKMIENLTTQSKTPSSLGKLSILDVKCFREAVERIEAYKKEFGTDSHFHDEVILSDSIMIPEKKNLWKKFISSLENNSSISLEKIERFKQVLCLLQKFDLIPLWMARFFLPEVSKLLTLECLDELLALFTLETDARLVQVSALQEEISDFKDNLDLFSDPIKAANSCTKILQFFEKLNTNHDPIMSIFSSSNPLIKIYALSMMGEAVELFDSAIKKLKGSSEINNRIKAQLFHKMLEGYYTLFESWTRNLSGPYLFYNRHDPLDEYLRKLQLCLTNSSFGPVTFLPSREFNVSSVILGNATFFDRSLPKTKEDVFTLIHQNLLFALQTLLGREIIEQTVLPDLINESSYHLEKNGFRLTGFRFPPGKMILSFNCPLQNHSAMAEVHFDQKSQQITLHVKFLGDARERWSSLCSVVKELDRVGLCPLVNKPKVDPLGFFYSVRLDNLDMIKLAGKELSQYTYFSLESGGGLVSVAIERFLNRLINYSNSDNLFPFFLKFADSQPSEELFELANIYGKALCHECMKSECIESVGLKPNMPSKEECVTLLFSSPLFLNVIEKFIYEYEYDLKKFFAGIESKKELNSVMKEIMIAYVQKFSKSGSEKERLATLVVQFILNRESGNLAETFNEFHSFPPEKIPLPLRWFFYHELITAGHPIADIHIKLQAALSDPYYKETWRSLDFWVLNVIQFMNESSLKDLVGLLKSVNFSGDNGQKIFKILYARVNSMITITEDDFQYLRSIYNEAFFREGKSLKPVDMAVGIPFVCYKKGHSQALLDAFKIFPDLEIQFQNILWKKMIGKKELLQYSVALNVVQTAKDDSVFFEALNFLSQDLGSQEFEDLIGRTLLERKFSDELTDVVSNFSERITREDRNERFICAALNKILSEDCDQPHHKWWIDKFASLIQSMHLQKIGPSLKQIVANGARFELFFQLLKPSEFSGENSQILQEIFAMSNNSKSD